ncbi:hypothetical protein ACPOL_4862 [Acidisarcina polymorpha]|uniref:Uncharacterized protein n=1 Tax=Acidisarcina polymorpha TaxID=2211140 RepID=A0A2Z5G5V4_9BACT|nr:hypothetical protein ACPOL_4862 [Acidisarcina polymorpha]
MLRPRGRFLLQCFLAKVLSMGCTFKIPPPDALIRTSPRVLQLEEDSG